MKFKKDYRMAAQPKYSLTPARGSTSKGRNSASPSSRKSSTKGIQKHQAFNKQKFATWILNQTSANKSAQRAQEAEAIEGYSELQLDGDNEFESAVSKDVRRPLFGQGLPNIMDHKILVSNMNDDSKQNNKSHSSKQL